VFESVRNLSARTPGAGKRAFLRTTGNVIPDADQYEKSINNLVGIALLLYGSSPSLHWEGPLVKRHAGIDS
jgi:hypothetical protein